MHTQNPPTCLRAKAFTIKIGLGEKVQTWPNIRLWDRGGPVLSKTQLRIFLPERMFGQFRWLRRTKPDTSYHVSVVGLRVQNGKPQLVAHEESHLQKQDPSWSNSAGVFYKIEGDGRREIKTVAVARPEDGQLVQLWGHGLVYAPPVPIVIGLSDDTELLIDVGHRPSVDQRYGLHFIPMEFQGQMFGWDTVRDLVSSTPERRPGPRVRSVWRKRRRSEPR